jgi:hypothetical protein
VRVLALSIVLAAQLSGVGMGQAPPTTIDRQVITGDELRAAGALRLTDMLWLIDDWHVSPVDGFTSEVSARGLAPLEQQTCKVMLNGHLVNLSALGTTSLNRLPVDITWIDSIEVFSVPQFHGGEFVTGGLVHIHTNSPERALSIRGRYALGNEIGDPGPFRFTPMATENVTRVGPDRSIGVSYAAARWYAEAGVVGHHYPLTDPAIAERISSVAGWVSEISHRAYMARIGVNLLGGTHEAFYAVSSFNDYFFLRPFGRELPTENHLKNASINGSIPLTDHDRVQYRIVRTVNRLSESENRFDLDFDWNQRTSIALVEAIHAAPASELKIGAGLRSAKVNTRYSLTKDGFAIPRLHGEFTHAISDRITQRYGAAVAFGSGSVGVEALVHHRIRVTARHTLDANVTFSQRLAEDDARIWYWMDHGYGFLTDAGVDVSVEGEDDGHRQVTADLSYSVSATDALQVHLGTFVRWFSNVRLTEQSFRFDPSDKSFSSPVTLNTRSGQVGGVDVLASWEPVPHLAMSAYYRVQGPVGGDRLFRDAWSSIPPHKIQSRLRFSPVDGFSIWGRLGYHSATEYPAFRNAEAESGGEYSGTVDDLVFLDMAVEKWLAGKTLRLSLGLSNVLNQPKRGHPIGDRFDMTAVLQGEVHINSAIERLGRLFPH